MLRNKLSVAVALATASVTLLSGGVIAANADEANPDNAIEAGVKAKKLQFTIHKYQSDGSSENRITADGTDESSKLDPLHLKKIEGVQFTLYPLEGTDMESTGSIPKAAEDNVKSFKQNPQTFIESHKANGIQITTNAEGVATVAAKDNASLKPMQYLVVETDITGAKVDSNKVHVTPSQPFLITLPMPGSNGSWNWDVHAFPKNTVNTIEKYVKSVGTAVGTKIEYMLKSTIPAPDKVEEQPQADQANKKTLSKYMIIDHLDPSLTLTNFTDDVKVSVINAEESNNAGNLGSAISDVNLTYASDSTPHTGDYTVTSKEQNGQKFIAITFTADGLDKLAAVYAAHPGAKVQVILTPTVTTNVADKGDTANKIDNTAYLIPSNNYDENTVYNNPNTPDVPTSTTVTTKFGNVKFKKVDDTTSAGLAGARFKLYVCGTDGTSIPAEAQPIEPTQDQNDSWDSATKTWKSKDNGTFEIKGLSYTKHSSADHDMDNTEVKYCLKEVEAPAGYAVLPNAIPFTVDAATVDLTSTNPIKNKKVTGSFNLPLTGSSALVISGLLGAGIAASGVLFLIMRKRKENAEA